ncbi:hypothetical protein ACFQZV_00105 [Microbacterium koreense]|uniref:Uncharacterized protein n=1 Tax=Microbacterium koreense TaxID=323761 RepID=A0ABW2ZMW5_9MICO
MARATGRSLWVAIPATVVCIGVLAALVWFARPMLPVAFGWVGDTLRTATAAEQAAEHAPAPADVVADGTELDCRDAYPDLLWAELIWRGDGLLGQNRTSPPLSTPDVGEALAPQVHVTCAWTFGDAGSIVSSLATVGEDAASVAEAAFTASGFTCETTDAVTTCRGAASGVAEEHVFRGGLWLATVVDGWMPEDYPARLSAFVWG